MGSGSWSKDTFASYTASKGMDVTSGGVIEGVYTNQEMFKSSRLHPALDPKNVIRECCDSKEHPNTKPVILGLDVTGSMGSSAVEVAKKLNVIMTNLYDKVPDVEFMIMGIGDLAYDNAPIQASQFESDIRIAEQLDKIWFEFGGGGNLFESYTAAWYFGARHTKLDCWGRGQKGIIITMGDERLNPYLPVYGWKSGLASATGDQLQGDIETKDLYNEAIQKFHIYHLNVNHRKNYDKSGIDASFKEYLDDMHYRTVTIDNIADEIIDIVVNTTNSNTSDFSASSKLNQNSNGEITW